MRMPRLALTLGALLSFALACTGKGGDDTASSTDAVDADGDGFNENQDCDDNDAAVNPDAAEICDGSDNDCDGEVDGRGEDGTTWYRDADGDGFGTPNTTQLYCSRPDGYVQDSSDCDDDNAAVFPDSEEYCDNLDNDCDGVIDDDPVDPTVWYRDNDGDGYGGSGSSTTDCDAPSGYAAGDSDCDDSDPAVNPGASERCSTSYDDDCDGQVNESDAVDMSTWYQDSDGDGYGTSSSQQACDEPSGYASQDGDCDDGDSQTNPGASDGCDGTDRNCDGRIEAGDYGTSAACAGLSCQDVYDNGGTSDGVYVLDTDNDGDPSDAFDAYCDMSTDGGGWTLLSWTGSSSSSPMGVPYPGLAICNSYTCARGSATDAAQLTELIQMSAEIGVGHNTSTMSSFTQLGGYTYASSFYYGNLSSISLDVSGGTGSCASVMTGTHNVLSGSTTYDGDTVYLAQAFRYDSDSFGAYTESGSYIWTTGVISDCNRSGAQPGVYLGNWSGNQYGPHQTNATGAWSVWAR